MMLVPQRNRIVASGRRIALAPWGLAVILLFSSVALGQQASREFRGNWTATVGEGGVFRGTWTAQALPSQPNLARGSWTLLSQTDEVLLEGTWSARKTGRGWQGTWLARARNGRPYSGTWQADAAGLSGKTLAEMLAATAKKQISGSWRSGRYQGNWWLEGAMPLGRNR